MNTESASLTFAQQQRRLRRPAKNLIYTIAIDPPRARGHSMLAKMLASSLLRTWFTGDIVVFRNSTTPLFPVERSGVREIEISTNDYAGFGDAQEAWRYKFRVRKFLDVKGYDKVMFLDSDCLALRNVDHLLWGDWDIAWQSEGPGMSVSKSQFSCFLTDEELGMLQAREGINSGTLAVRAELYHDVMAEWERIDLSPTPRDRTCSDQGSWNRLLIDTKLRNQGFERGEVQFPMYLHPKWGDWKEAALLHNLGGNLRDKLKFTFGAYMQTFFWNDRGTMMDLLEM